MRVALVLLIAFSTTIPGATQTLDRAAASSAFRFPARPARPTPSPTSPASPWGTSPSSKVRASSCRARADPHRRHRHPSAAARQLGSGVCRDVQPEWQRRHDRHQLDQGVGLSRRADPPDRHPQRGHRPRRRHPVATEERPRVRVHLPDRRRDVRFPERRQRRTREAGACPPGARSRQARAGARKARSGAAREWAATASRAVSAPRRACSRTSRAATRSACWCSATTAATSRFSASASGRRLPTWARARCCRNRCPGRGRAGSRLVRRPAVRRPPTRRPAEHEGRGSIIVVVATDAPLLPHQLERIVRRVGMGLGRLGSWAGNSSGDLFLAFSTANAGAARPDGTPSLTMLPNDRIDPLFRATIDATEEAVVNAMLAAQTMTGADGIRAFGLPGDRVVAALRKYNRMK